MYVSCAMGIVLDMIPECSLPLVFSMGISIFVELDRLAILPIGIVLRQYALSVILFKVAHVKLNTVLLAFYRFCPVYTMERDSISIVSVFTP